MEIAVITYDHPHRKTQDLLFRLLANGHKPFIMALPWEPRGKSFTPLYPHRPDECMPIMPQRLARVFGLNYVYNPCTSCLKSMKDHLFLIAGAGVLTDIEGVRIVNCHPGYLPHCRGLDAFKWAIYNGDPLGCTLHFIGKEVDAGRLIRQELTSIRALDTYGSLAYRHYEHEVELLASAPELVSAEQPIESFLEIGTVDELGRQSDVNRRMSHEQEVVMMQRFNARMGGANADAGNGKLNE